MLARNAPRAALQKVGGVVAGTYYSRPFPPQYTPFEPQFNSTQNRTISRSRAELRIRLSQHEQVQLLVDVRERREQDDRVEALRAMIEASSSDEKIAAWEAEIAKIERAKKLTADDLSTVTEEVTIIDGVKTKKITIEGGEENFARTKKKIGSQRRKRRGRWSWPPRSTPLPSRPGLQPRTGTGRCCRRPPWHLR